MTKQKWIVVVSVLATLVLLLVVVAMVAGKETDEPGAAEAAAPTQPPPQPAIPAASDAGTIETDLSGRQVRVPTNPAGDILSSETDDGGSCEEIRSPAGMQIQRVNMYPLLFSTDSGPSKVEGAVPTGYAPGPRGAVLAGSNYLWLMQSGGTAGKQTALDYVVADAGFAELVESEVAEGENTTRNTLGAPVAFKVRSCSTEAVVIDYAYEVFGDESGPFSEPKWLVQSVLVVRENEQWKLSMRKGSYVNRGITDPLEGFTTWQL